MKIKRFGSFNSLPAKPAHLQNVQKALSRGPLNRTNLVKASGLSMTQTLCAVDELIVQGIVQYDEAAKLFTLVESAP